MSPKFTRTKILKLLFSIQCLISKTKEREIQHFMSTLCTLAITSRLPVEVDVERALKPLQPGPVVIPMPKRKKAAGSPRDTNRVHYLVNPPPYQYTVQPLQYNINPTGLP